MGFPRQPKSCPTCTLPIDGRKSYCSTACRPICAVEGCGRKVWGKQPHCDTHYNKLRVKSCPSCPTCGIDIDWRKSYCSDACRPPCAFDTCSRPVHGRKRYCEAHWEQWQYHGKVKDLTWAQEWVCVVCGVAVEPGSGWRRYCSARCQGRANQNPGRPKFYNCVCCGFEVSLIVPSTKAGQFKRADSKFCKRCKWKTRTGVSVGEIAKRDGTECKICGDEVDLNAGPKDPFRGSVDHIVPRSRGGSNDPSNLQLSHLWCNQVKSDRADFTFIPDKAVS
jgi:hypothetical protein